MSIAPDCIFNDIIQSFLARDIVRDIVRVIVLHGVLLASAPTPALAAMAVEHNREAIRFLLERIAHARSITERFDLFQA